MKLILTLFQDQKAEEAEQREEDQEKRRFLSLSDREKVQKQLKIKWK